MSRIDRQRVRGVFMDVAGLPEAARPAALDRACGADAALRAEVEALLEADARAGGFMASPTGDAPEAPGSDAISGAATLADPVREGPGTRIGPFKVLQLIGEGGFGSVFMAEQERPVSRRVALKIIKLGMDTRQVIARFEAERQALALMDHPNIARVLDAGATETGRPYFVMELCKGDPIHEYCDKHSLSITERLELFGQVCTAVQHAHTKGIIHRDIKPSNVLVTTQDGRPHAKVIDFGIAKATASRLTEKTLFTEHRALIGTPEYMSPEQAEGSLDIDTRTDVYSLGVLLYELLTGTTPFSGRDLRSAAYGEIQRIIREVEPPRPSTRLSANTDTLASVAARRHTEPRKLGTLVRGDLDWIVMKALEKDRHRRYETANGLAMDIQRHLRGEAVVAAPPGAAYRVRKFIRRHRVRVAAAGLVAAALVLGMAGTAWQASVARKEAMLARAAEAEAEAARDAEKARADELKQVSDFQAGMLAQIDPTMAGVRLTQDVNRRFAAAMERLHIPDEERTQRAEVFRQEWLRVNATDVAMALIDETILSPAVRAIDEQFADQPLVDAQLRMAIAERYSTLGLYDAALLLYDSALSTLRRVLGEENSHTLITLREVGRVLGQQGRLAEAEQHSREALEKLGRVLGADNPEALAAAYNLGLLFIHHGSRLSDAGPFLREAMEGYRRHPALGDEHPHTIAAIHAVGTLLLLQGKPDEAELYLREALETSRRVGSEDDPVTSMAMLQMGSLRRVQGRAAEAELFHREALAISRRTRGEDHPVTVHILHQLGIYLWSQGAFSEAERCLQETLTGYRRTVGDAHPFYTLPALNDLGQILWSQGKFSDAEPYWREALESRRRELGDGHHGTIISLSNLGMLLIELDRLEEAERLLREAADTSRRVLGQSHHDTLSAQMHYCRLLHRQGKHRQAVALLLELEPEARLAFTGLHVTRLAVLLADLGRARVGLGQDSGDYALAVANLIEAHRIFADAEGEHARRTLDCVSALVDLYTAWHEAEPEVGHDLKAAQWRNELAADPPQTPDDP